MPDEKTHSTESHQDTRWTSLVEELRQWPSDAPEWEVVQVQGFIDQVQTVAGQKCQEREEAGRFQLQQALDQLRENHEEAIEGFGFRISELANWQATCCPIDRTDEWTETTNDLLEQLAQFRLLNQQVPQNIQERRKHRADSEAVDDRISALLKQLDQDFSATAPEPPKTLDEDTEEDDQPSPEPTSPGQGPSSDSPDSDQEQKAEEDVSLSADVPQEESSSPEEEAKPEPLPQSEEHEPTHIQTTPPEPQLPDEKPPHLRSVRDVALLLQEDDSDEHWVSLGWSLLAEGDWAGAYWLASSLKVAGHDVPVAPELIAVLQGSRWLENDTDSLVSDIPQIASKWAPQNTASERLVRLAAALRPRLIAPHIDLVDWLPQKDEVNSALGALANAVHTFALEGYPLRTEDIKGVEGTTTHGKVLEETVEQAHRLLKNNQDRKLKMLRATNVLHRLVDQEGDLTRLLTPVIENQADQVDQVRQCMSGFKERKQIVERIRQLDQERISARPSRPITGVPRDQLVRSVEEAVGLAHRWCFLIVQKQDPHYRGDWWSDHVKDLRRQVQDVLPAVNAELEQMQAQDQPEEKVALGRVLQRAIGQVTGLLSIEEQPDIENIEAWMKRESGSLEEALARRLLWMPEIPLDEEGHPEEAYRANIAEALRQSLVVERSPREACILRIESQDFRFTDVLWDALENDEDRREIEDLKDDNLKGARAALADRVNEVKGAIEQRVVDGLLFEEERADLITKLEPAAIEEPLYLKPLFQRLEDIEQKLNQKLEDRLQELESQWKEMRQGLEQNIQADQLEPVEAFIQKAFEQRDTMVVEEGLARLREVLQGESEWLVPPDERDIFKEFQEASPSIESGLSSLGNVNQLAGMIEQGQTWEGMPFDTLPQARRDEAAKALKAWHQLKRQQGQSKAAHRHIPVLLAYLGFHLPEGESAVRLRRSGQDGLYCQVDASASDLARPIPQLGSQASGCYNVVCLWEQPGAASIGAFLHDLGLDTKTVIIFFLERLTDRRRRDIAAQARERELAIVVLDEILLVFLAKSDDTRLPAFLRCSLPYSALNPYTPFQAGNVPPEIYYGRDEMVRQLQNEGSCIVFGGRQLGKSALLRQVEREFHQPDSEQFAWVEDIKLVGDPLTGEQPVQLWIKLRDGFKKLSLIKDSIKATQPDNIIKHIENAITESPQRRVLVMFDEADHFLNADAREGFQVVNGLRTLMQDTQSRFKVVFTGLHDVQRFNNIANQPLAHFGQNLLVGPLEARPARQLVREPLRALGYRLVDETTVLKVLSYTNYHPGLIQYFCHELVRRLQAKRPSSGPPYEVRSDDVEAVYRSPSARQVIRERLDWTLALDPRYQCLAWAMICEQKETRDSYVRPFSVAELLKLAQEWWSQGFKGVDTESLRGLLGEMVGLGILVRNLENRYLLRSPNLVRLMGTEKDIENRLLELSDKSQPTQFQSDSQHLLLDAENRLYSPLTLVQEGRLQQTRSSGVSLIFGSQALGLDLLDQALKRGSEIPAQELTQANRTCAWLDSHAQKQQGIEQVLAYGWLRGTGGDMAQCVWRVLEKCKDFNQRRRRPLQVVFFLNPEAAWAWLKLPADRRTDLEDRADPIYLRRWDEVGIQQRLSQAEKLDSPEVCQKVLKAAGGWPLLLDELLRRCTGDDNPRSYAEMLVEEMGHPRSELGSKLLQQVGLDAQAEPFRVLKTLVECDKVSDADLETLGDLIEGDPPLTPEGCKAAVEFLRRLGCIENRDGEYSAEPVLGRVAGLL